MLTRYLFLCLLLPLIVRSEDYIEATADDFNSIIKNNDLTLVKFYAEWCGHCKRMAPEFAKAATELKNHRHPVTLVKVNCPNHQSLCERFGVSGYPTLKIFHKGDLEHPREYQGPREAAGIIKYMKGQAGPDSSEFSSEHQITELLETTNDPVFVTTVKDIHEPLFETHKILAKEFRDRFNFVHIFRPTDKPSIKRFLPKRVQTKLEPEFEELAVGANKQDDIRNWVLDVWGGLVAWHQDQVPQESDDHIDRKKKPVPSITVFFDIDYERDPKGTNYIRNRILKVVKQLKDEKVDVKFSMASAVANQRLLDSSYNLKWKKGDKPVVAAMFMKKKFVMRDEFSYEALKKWAVDVSHGKVDAYLKTEPVPDSQPDAVIKVVASTFDQVVRDQNKFVLIEFFAPWCGHCKNLKPIYEELAQKVKSKSDIVIAAMDATENDVPNDFAVSGFPTIFWVNKRNEISAYNGGRTVEDFLKFIESNTDHTFKHDEL